MVALGILGCLVMAYFFMALTAVFKGILALLDTMIDMLEIWAILLLGGIGILIVQLLAEVFSSDFWHVFWIVVGIIVVCAIFSWLIGLIGAIFVFVFEAAIYVATLVYEAINFIVGKLGDWSEIGLKFFLGLINKQIVRS